jgi:hypothetical protein
MSGIGGIVGGIDYSLLFSSSSSTSDASAAILNALYSSTPLSTAVSTGNPLTDLKLAQQNQTADVAKEAQVPQVARDIAAFQQAVANAPDIKTALSNPNVLKVLLTANNLGDQVQYPALAQKVLLSDPSDSNSLVNQMGNTTWLNAVNTYNFAKNGLAELQNPKVVSTLTNAYAEVMWRQSLDQATPGLANALSFLGQASSIHTADDILGDATNRTVVTTALGIPEQIAFQDLTAQEQAITNRLDISKLQDPKFVTSLTDQYLLIMQQNAKASAGGGTDLTSLALQASGLVV